MYLPKVWVSVFIAQIPKWPPNRGSKDLIASIKLKKHTKLFGWAQGFRESIVCPTSDIWFTIYRVKRKRSLTFAYGVKILTCSDFEKQYLKLFVWSQGFQKWYFCLHPEYFAWVKRSRYTDLHVTWPFDPFIRYN